MAALQVLSVQQSKPIRIRRPVWQHAMYRSKRGDCDCRRWRRRRITHPMTRPYVVAALTWVGNQVFGSVAAMPAPKPIAKPHVESEALIAHNDV